MKEQVLKYAPVVLVSIVLGVVLQSVATQARLDDIAGIADTWKAAAIYQLGEAEQCRIPK